MNDADMTLKEALDVIANPKKYVKYFDEAKDFCFNIKLHQALNFFKNHADDIIVLDEANRSRTIFFEETLRCYDEYLYGEKIAITTHGNPKEILLIADKQFYNENFGDKNE